MHGHLAVFTAIAIGLGLMLASTQASAAQQNPVTAIDIALEPDGEALETIVDLELDALTGIVPPRGYGRD